MRFTTEDAEGRRWQIQLWTSLEYFALGNAREGYPAMQMTTHMDVVKPPDIREVNCTITVGDTS